MDTKDLLRQFAPFCYFHRQEKSFPIAYDTFVAHSDLQVIAGKKKATLSAEYKERLNDFSPAQVLEQWLVDHEDQRAVFAQGELSFLPQTQAEGMAGSFDSVSKTLQALPIQTQVSLVSLGNEDNEMESFYRLTYVFLYRDNLPPYAFGAGKHLSDIEHVSVYVKRHDDGSWADNIAQMYYSAHGDFEGSWVSANRIKLKDGHPVVFIARGSHADYPRLSTGLQFFSSTRYVWRIFGFANDQIAKSIGYQISEDDLLPMPKPIRENYLMSAGGGVALGKPYLLGPEPIYSTTKGVRQLPVKVGCLWNPERQATKKEFNEQVLSLADFGSTLT